MSPSTQSLWAPALTVGFALAFCFAHLAWRIATWEKDDTHSPHSRLHNQLRSCDGRDPHTTWLFFPVDWAQSKPWATLNIMPACLRETVCRTASFMPLSCTKQIHGLILDSFQCLILMLCWNWLVFSCLEYQRPQWCTCKNNDSHFEFNLLYSFSMFLWSNENQVGRY